MLYIFIKYITYQLSDKRLDYGQYLLSVVKNGNNALIKKCAIRWLLSSAYTEKNPDKILNIYTELMKHTGIPLRKKTAIAIIESAIWLKDRDTVELLLPTLKNIDGMDARTIKRLDYLKLWRFSESLDNVVGLSGFSSPRISRYTFLPYLDCFARGVLAESQDNKEDALKYYQEALKSIPQQSSEYTYAMERCNSLLNEV